MSFKGKHHTEEVKQKLRKRFTGRVFSEESKKKMRDSCRGRKPSAATIASVIKWHTGRKQPKEWIEMIKNRNSGSNNYNWKGGVSKNKEYRNWQKNKRNRTIKRLQDNKKTHTFGEWELLKKQYGYMCPCCKRTEPIIKLTEDHIIPLSKGGSDYIENIQPLCMHCNAVKHTKSIKY